MTRRSSNGVAFHDFGFLVHHPKTYTLVLDGVVVGQLYCLECPVFFGSSVDSAVLIKHGLRNEVLPIGLTSC